MEKIKDNKTVRLVTMIIVGVNTIATMYGYTLIPFTNEEISIAISAVAMAAVEIWNHYKNNNYTPEAKEGQRVTDKLKAEKKAK